MGVLAGAAAFFLLVGILLRRVREPAIQRLVGVVWFLSAACVGGAGGSAADDMSAPCGAILALYAPILTVGAQGWVYAIGIAAAAAAMAVSVPLRNTPLLALGTLAMFGYVTSVVLQYFHRSLGVPAALAIAGALILALAVVSARLRRAARPPKPDKPGAEEPSHRDLPRVS